MAAFQPGQSGNPAGRPPGARSKFSEAFIAALAEDFTTHGKAVIEACRDTRPGEYIRACIALLPKVLPGDAPAIDLGDTTTPQGVIAAMGKIVAGMASGELTFEQANQLSDIIEIQRRAIETGDHEVRLREIEARATAATGGRAYG